MGKLKIITMIRYSIFVFTIIFWLITIIAIGQDSINSLNKQDRYLRAVVTLIDTIPITCKCNDSIQNVAYKFKLNYTYFGQCTSEEIIICNAKSDFLYEQKRWGGYNTTFFWTLYKIANNCNKLPLYRKGGNF